MGKLPEYKKFFAVHGKKAENLSDLKRIMFSMSDKEFKHHVSYGRNDFASWTKDILHRDYLAVRIKKVHSKKEVLELLDDELMKDKELEVMGSDDFKKFIVKEFVFGMIFGMILGIILSNLL